MQNLLKPTTKPCIGTSETWLSCCQVASTSAIAHLPLVLGGEPGVGKTTLWEYACRVAGYREYLFITSEDDLTPEIYTYLNQYKVPVFLHHMNTFSNETRERFFFYLQQTRTIWWGASLALSDTNLFHRWIQQHGINQGALKIYIPSLRNRQDDIPVLAEWYVRETNLQYNRGIQGFEADAMQRLRIHPWWGNVRELVEAVRFSVYREVNSPWIRLSTVQKALRQVQHQIDQPDWRQRCYLYIERTLHYLYEKSGSTHSIKPWHLIIHQVRLRTIEICREMTGGDEEQVSQILGISRSRMKRYLRTVHSPHFL